MFEKLPTCLFAGLLATATGLSLAYPVKPITIIVPFAAGTVNDIGAREVAKVLSALGQQAVVVENRAGAEGTIGTFEPAEERGGCCSRGQGSTWQTDVRVHQYVDATGRRDVPTGDRHQAHGNSLQVECHRAHRCEQAVSMNGFQAAASSR